MTVPNLFLSKATTIQVTRFRGQQLHISPIVLEGVVVGLTKAGPLPEGLVLPSGLERDTLANLSLSQLPEPHPCPAPHIKTLRYKSVLSVSPQSVDSLLVHIRNPGAVTINGILFTNDKLISDIIPESGVASACDVQIFQATSQHLDSPVSAMVFTTLSTDTKDVPVDAIAYCARNATRDDVLACVALSVQRVLAAAVTVSRDLDVRVAHYPVFGGGLSLTVVAPTSVDREDEGSSTRTAWRRGVHDMLFLPLDRPLLRRASKAYASCGSSTASDQWHGGWVGRLRNVHVGVKLHDLGEEGVSQHWVQGSYLYCHYQQDKFNDSGWGCAYRSLQTILSWCALEKYSSFKGGVLPTHKDIQKALVDLGDKPSSFLGSKEWIGANEVCYALDKLTGISSKILHVSRGAEMESKGRELAKHFDEQGSPVMVGGGVLAWTILGVARNSRTGKTRFLILDPHYEGRDELATIQNKGWVGWKSADVFNADAFYNLCMPLRPAAV